MPWGLVFMVYRGCCHRRRLGTAAEVSMAFSAHFLTLSATAARAVAAPRPVATPRGLSWVGTALCGGMTGNITEGIKSGTLLTGGFSLLTWATAGQGATPL